MRRKQCSVCNQLFDSNKLKNGECPTCRRKGAEQPSNPTKSVSGTSKDSGTCLPENQKTTSTTLVSTTVPSTQKSSTAHETDPPMLTAGDQIGSVLGLMPGRIPMHTSDRHGSGHQSFDRCIIEPICCNKQQKLADRLRASRDTGVGNTPHVIVEARAGTGKTTTLIEGLKRVKGIESTLTPSPQQAKVWEAMELSKGKAQTICFCAFNKSIATELQSRVPDGCDAMTMHSLGLKTVQKAFGRVQVNSYRVQDIISELLEKDIRELRRTKPEVIKATEELVDLCKMNLYDPNKPVLLCIGEQDGLEQLANYYDVDCNGHAAEIFDLVPRVLERCKDVARDGCIDFNDMIWIPVVLDLNVYKYDLLLIDEFQDCNRCQHALAKKAGRRLICCGDPKQSIYGFAGADCNSMARMEQELSATERGCIHLPLTVTRRCGKAIVREAKKIVPDFEAFETNPEGKISRMTIKGGQVVDPNPNALDGKDYSYRVVPYQDSVQDGDMVLCRVNSPLVSECFRFIRAGRKANIQGRDVGAGLIKTIQKVMKDYEPKYVPSGTAYDGDVSYTLTGEIETLHHRLDDWLCAECKKENAKRNPSEQRLVNLQDRRDCLLCFTEGVRTTDEVVKKIEQVFTDDKSNSGIRLSSVHKAKGLEADSVYFLMPKEAPCPHPMAKTPWEKQQEMNILYVGITRAKHNLIYVT